jgi:hypothetical protein
VIVEASGPTAKRRWPIGGLVDLYSAFKREWPHSKAYPTATIAGGYPWSPKRNANKARNPFYECMREVAPGGIIFSFRDTRIAALGIARSYCYESPKPTEFVTAGSYWEVIGWKIDVSFCGLNNRSVPARARRWWGSTSPRAAQMRAKRMLCSCRAMDRWWPCCVKR